MKVEYDFVFCWIFSSGFKCGGLREMTQSFLYEGFFFILYELSGVYINLFSIWKFYSDMIRWKLIYLVTC